MAAIARLTEVVLYDTLVNYLVSMARTVEGVMNRALDSIVSLENPRTSALPSEVFLLEPRINEMEIVIDEQDRKSTRLNSSHGYISYAVFCLKKKIQYSHTS